MFAGAFANFPLAGPDPNPKLGANESHPADSMKKYLQRVGDGFLFFSSVFALVAVMTYLDHRASAAKAAQKVTQEISSAADREKVAVFQRIRVQVLRVEADAPRRSVFFSMTNGNSLGVLMPQVRFRFYNGAGTLLGERAVKVSALLLPGQTKELEFDLGTLVSPIRGEWAKVDVELSDYGLIGPVLVLEKEKVDNEQLSPAAVPAATKGI